MYACIYVDVTYHTNAPQAPLSSSYIIDIMSYNTVINTTNVLKHICLLEQSLTAEARAIGFIGPSVPIRGGGLPLLPLAGILGAQISYDHILTFPHAHIRTFSYSQSS